MDSRRQDLLLAMAEAVGSKGYRETAVADVLAEAKASRTTFYRHFHNKQECFLAAYDQMAEWMLATIASRCDPEQPWLERIVIGLETMVDLLAENPRLARAAVVEVAAAGDEARRRRWRTVTQLTELMGPGPEMAAGERLPANAALMAAGAVEGLIFDQLQAGEASALPRLMPDLIFALLVPYLGPAAALEEMSRRPAASPK